MTKEPNDENRLIAHQKRAISSSHAGADFLSHLVAEEFALRIAATNRQFSQCADLFSFSNCVHRSLNSLDNVSRITRYERSNIAELLNDKLENTVRTISLDNVDKLLMGADLLVSALGLHWENDITAILTRSRAVMKKDGLLLIGLPARGTLFELQDCLTRAELELVGGATTRVDRFPDMQQAGTILQDAGFKLPVIDQETIAVRYDDMFALINDLRAMGSTSVTNQSANTKYCSGLFKRANEIYLENHSDADGRVRASFNIAYLTAWSPHDNQQKPLKPGSAKISLQTALKSK